MAPFLRAIQERDGVLLRGENADSGIVCVVGRLNGFYGPLSWSFAGGFAV